MATEKYTNNAASTLNGAINNSVTTLVVTSAANFPTSGNFRILIDSEIMVVTAVSGTTFTVSRAQENTSGASHSDLAPVTHVFTAGAIDEIRGNQISRGALSGRPAAGIKGNLFLPTDDFTIGHDNGTSYLNYGPNFSCTPPVDADYSWVNQGSATVVATATSIRLNSPSGDTSFNYRVRKKAAPSTPYTIIAAFLYQLKSGPTNNLVGLCFRESSSGKLIGGGPFQTDGGHRFVVFKMTDATTFSSTYIDVTQGRSDSVQWMRIKDDGTNRTWSWSSNGLDWIQVATEGNTTFMTANEVGFFTNNDSSGMTLLHWAES